MRPREKGAYTSQGGGSTLQFATPGTFQNELRDRYRVSRHVCKHYPPLLLMALLWCAVVLLFCLKRGFVME